MLTGEGPRPELTMSAVLATLENVLEKERTPDQALIAHGDVFSGKLATLNLACLDKARWHTAGDALPSQQKNMTHCRVQIHLLNQLCHFLTCVFLPLLSCRKATPLAQFPTHKEVVPNEAQ